MNIPTNRIPSPSVSPLLSSAIGVLMGTATTLVLAQSTVASGGTVGADPNPYYVGVNQAFTHDSNVYRTPSGPGDTYSSTSLIGGFDQPFGRQRASGSASVSYNRYQNQSQLDNTSYNLAAGLDWSTVHKIAGNVNIGLSQSLASPAVSGVAPSASRNVAQTENVGASARWGGDSLVTLEASLGYSKLDYSSTAYTSADSWQDTASLAAYYRPGAALRVGVAYRVNETHIPRAFLDPNSAQYTSNSQTGRNIDLLADYTLSGLASANARVSFTDQTNSLSGDGADFSGLTGRIGLNYRATGRIGIDVYAARDAGFNSSPYNGYIVTPATPATGVNTPVLTPVSGLYENNQVTNSVGINVSYAATAKIAANAGLRYSRARLGATTIGSQGEPTTDVVKGGSFGLTYAFARNIGFGCNYSHESRDVSGGTTYAYSANTVGCSAQVTLR